MDQLQREYDEYALTLFKTYDSKYDPKSASKLYIRPSFLTYVAEVIHKEDWSLISMAPPREFMNAFFRLVNDPYSEEYEKVLNIYRFECEPNNRASMQRFIRDKIIRMDNYAPELIHKLIIMLIAVKQVQVNPKSSIFFVTVMFGIFSKQEYLPYYDDCMDLTLTLISDSTACELKNYQEEFKQVLGPCSNQYSERTISQLSQICEILFKQNGIRFDLSDKEAEIRAIFANSLSQQVNIGIFYLLQQLQPSQMNQILEDQARNVVRNEDRYNLFCILYQQYHYDNQQMYLDYCYCLINNVQDFQVGINYVKYAWSMIYKQEDGQVNMTICVETWAFIRKLLSWIIERQEQVVDQLIATHLVLYTSIYFDEYFKQLITQRFEGGIIQVIICLNSIITRL